jgi:hypothetical protein
MPQPRTGSSGGTRKKATTAKAPARSSAAKPAAARSAAARSAAAKPAATKPAAAKPAAAKPAARSSRASASKPAATKAAASKAAPKKAPSAAAKAASDAEARFEALAKRVRNLNERIIEAGRDAGESTLSNYEKALKSIATGIEKGPGKSEIDWISNFATAQAKFIRDMTDTWTKAARDMLK